MSRDRGAHCADQRRLAASGCKRSGGCARNVTQRIHAHLESFVSGKPRRARRRPVATEPAPSLSPTCNTQSETFHVPCKETLSMNTVAAGKRTVPACDTLSHRGKGLPQDATQVSRAKSCELSVRRATASGFAGRPIVPGDENQSAQMIGLGTPRSQNEHRGAAQRGYRSRSAWCRSTRSSCLGRFRAIPAPTFWVQIRAPLVEQEGPLTGLPHDLTPCTARMRSLSRPLCDLDQRDIGAGATPCIRGKPRPQTRILR